MAWLNSGGRTAAEFPMSISGGGSIPSYLLQRHDPYAEIIKTLAPAIKQYIQEKKADDIANQLMNMEQPPRAQAVDPSLQGAMATAPATGGVDAYKAQKLYQDYISKQQADQAQSTNEYWQNEVRKAQVNKLNAAADDPGEGSTAEPPVVDEATGMIWNGKRWIWPPPGAGKVVGAELPSGVTKEMYRNSKHPKPYSPAQAFRDWQAEHQDQPVTTTTERPSKELDASTAKAILAEAGGDKEKARQIARERGYAF